jgi:hypothetical protein
MAFIGSPSVKLLKLNMAEYSAYLSIRYPGGQVGEHMPMMVGLREFLVFPCVMCGLEPLALREVTIKEDT